MFKTDIKSVLNNLGFKVGIYMLLVAIVPLSIYLILNNIVVSKYFLKVEQESVISKVENANKIFRSEALNLQELAEDNGIWDDFYKKIEEKDIEWFKENYSEWVPDNFSIDLIVIANKNREIIDQYGLKYTNDTELFDDDKINAVLSGKYDKKKNYPSGIKIYNGNLYIIGISPILLSDYEGPSRGIIIFGKEVNTEFLQNIKDKFGYDILFSYRNKLVMNMDISKEIKELSDIIKEVKNQETFELGKSKIVGSISIKDLSDENIGKLYIAESRYIFLHTLGLIHRNAFFIFILSCILSLILSAKLKNIILNPMKGLENEISKIRENNSSIRFKINGPNEFIKFSSSIVESLNQMNHIIYRYKKENKNLRLISNTDGLTSLYNHRYFYECFNEKINSGLKSITVLFCDIDKFKLINDIHGHIVGDMILKEIGNIIKESVEENGLIFRYGGEEFVVMMDNYTAEKSFDIAENIRINIIKSKQIQKYSGDLPVTISIGLSSYPNDSVDAKDLIEKADKAMYFAKQNGRNQCCIYKEEIEKIIMQNCTEFAKKEILIDSAFAISAAIDAKDVYTGKHSELVTRYSLLLAEELELSVQDKYALRIGALLHDCGKIGIPDNIINKPTRLTDEEFNIIKNHTMLGHNIAKHIVKNPVIIACVRNHHERWDGEGYPDGLSDKFIPIHARIVCIADAYHAMISDRPYRKSLSQYEAFEQLRKNKGTQFDPYLVELFIKTVKEDSGV
ncbi:MAG: diguanylate cyclase [Tepidibacter sp.]|jgi:diguanylate cyclase (GGDEF)-like protein/putative nucleotidyltransferase with HDIG domain|uniref:diguanylate cyclase n=1 Tax=Tepidibacter sp. TaxID=2529387 RepID=UPI0025E87E53|nr:diguanylate cyclase [Tepidibacter sp.]MCT4508468.1 diguanylate cyclase [Tepidibacter sp.]